MEYNQINVKIFIGLPKKQRNGKLETEILRKHLREEKKRQNEHYVNDLKTPNEKMERYHTSIFVQ